jgi:hypothetical protein
MTNINFDEPSTGNVNSDDKTALAIKNTGSGGGMLCESTNDGIIGKSISSAGVRGESERTNGVAGICTEQIADHPRSRHPSSAAIAGYSTSLEWGYGVAGNIKGVGGAGVWGSSDNDAGKGTGVRGESKNGVGVYGVSQANDGVHGESTGTGVVGISNGKAGTGIFGETVNPEGGAGVWGKSQNWVGVFGESQTQVGIWGKAPIAGRFEGAVEVTGEVRVTEDIKLLNADCAEDFDISELESESIGAGTVMVLTENGSLQSSYREYDRKAAGIVSGAKGYKPALILDRQQSQYNNQNDKNKKVRLPIALMGKVYCKVDATHSSIEIGDLLTTSSRRGHAMKAEDPMKAFGAVIGKALGSLKDGLGMIPVLVTLQ